MRELADDDRGIVGTAISPVQPFSLNVKNVMQPTQVDVLAQMCAAFSPEPLRFEGALTGGLDGGAYREHVEGKSWEARRMRF